METNSKNFVES